MVIPMNKEINTRNARFLSRNTLWYAITWSFPPLVEFLFFAFVEAKFWYLNASIGEIFPATFAGALHEIQTVNAEKIMDNMKILGWKNISASIIDFPLSNAFSKITGTIPKESTPAKIIPIGIPIQAKVTACRFTNVLICFSVVPNVFINP